MSYHPFRELWLKALAVVLAVMLWLSVSGESIVERGLEIPLQFENIPPGLEVVGDTPDAVSVRVRGVSSVIGRLDPGAVVARLDLSGEEPGRQLYDMFAGGIEVPSGVEVTSVVPATVTLMLERAGITRVVPIVPDIEGRPADGRAVGRITTVPSSVEVVGPQTRLHALREALTGPVSIEGATGDVVADVTVGVGDPTLRLATPLTARVTVEIVPAPVERVLEDVTVEVRGVKEDAEFRPEPDRIAVTVRGPRSVVRALGASDVRAFVDAGVLAELSSGRYNLPVAVEVGDGVRVARIDPPSVDLRRR